jgi:hypothetical protein
MASAVDITNRALLSIGARAQVSSISPSDGSTEADAAAVLFTPTFEALARSAHWNCLRKQLALSVIAAAKGTPENPLGTSLPLPPTPWQYAYQLPADCLNMRSLVPSQPASGAGVSMTTYSNAAPLHLPGAGQIPFAVAYSTDAGGSPIQVVLTNQSQAQAVYTVNQPNPVIWDSQFQAAMVSSLAAYFVPALSLNLALMQGAIKNSEVIIAQARVADGNEGPTSMDSVPDWMRARGGESRFYGIGGWNGHGGYGSMVWPG